jgi:hypothetical protein
MHRKVLKHLLTCLQTVQLYHWFTSDYGNHKATDGLYNELNALVDNYVEVFLCKFGKSRDAMRHLRLKVLVKSKEDFVAYLSFFVSLLEYGPLGTISNMDKGLSAIRDEMVKSLRQCLYLIDMQ